MSRPTLYIHVGLPKTGTTSFQVFCMRNRARLANMGLCYPPTLCPPQPTASQHRYINCGMRHSIETGDGTDVLARVTNDVLETGLSRALISEEQFSYDSFRSAPFLGQLMSSFDCRILLVLRRQDRWAESMYAQAVRGGYKHSFQAFLGAGATRERLDHRGLIAIWAEVFGPENIIPLTYPEDGSSSLDLILTAIGINRDAGQQNDRFNPSLGAEAIAFIRALDLPKCAYGAFNQRYSHLLREATDPTEFSGFDPVARAEFLARWSGAEATYLDGPPLTPLNLSEQRKQMVFEHLLGLQGAADDLPALSQKLIRSIQVDRAA